MAIFGNAILLAPNLTVLYNVAGTTTDVYLNYFWGVLILIPFIISTLLNPVVFIFKYNQPRSAASMLYMILSVSDFLTNLLRPIILSYELLKPELDHFQSVCTTTKLVRTFYYNFFSEISLATTACLAIMRFIAIQFPFYRPRKRILIWAILVWTLLFIIPIDVIMLWVSNNQLGKNGFYLGWLRSHQYLFLWEAKNTFVKVICMRYTITTLISLAASGLTMIAMLRNKSAPHARPRNNKGCVAIVVMNAALIIHLILSFKDTLPMIFDPDYDKLYDLQEPVTLEILSQFLLGNGGVILSAFNPLVIVIFSSVLKEFIRVRLSLARGQSQETVTEAVEMSNRDRPELGE